MGQLGPALPEHYFREQTSKFAVDLTLLRTLLWESCVCPTRLPGRWRPTRAGLGSGSDTRGRKEFIFTPN